MENKDIYNLAVSKFGLKKQIIKSIEEFSELIQILSKELNLNENVSEIATNNFISWYNSYLTIKIRNEIVDCDIMLSQLKHHYFLMENSFEIHKAKSLRKFLEEKLGLKLKPEDKINNITIFKLDSIKEILLQKGVKNE